MAHLRFTDVQDRPTEFLDFTSLTLDEFQLLVPPFEAAFQVHMREWRLDGKPRTARQFSVYKTGDGDGACHGGGGGYAHKSREGADASGASDRTRHLCQRPTNWGTGHAHCSSIGGRGIDDEG